MKPKYTDKTKLDDMDEEIINVRLYNYLRGIGITNWGQLKCLAAFPRSGQRKLHQLVTQNRRRVGE